MHSKFLAKCLPLASVLWLLNPTIAMACEVFVPISNDQVKELRNTMLNEASDELDVVFAYEDLLCSERESVREFALRSALRSKSEALKNLVVRDLLLNKEVITVQLSANESALPLALKFIEEAPSLTFDVNRVDRIKNLIDTRGSCATKVSYDSQAVEINLGCYKGSNIQGRLEFDGSDFVGDLALTVDEKKLGKIKGKMGLLN